MPPKHVVCYICGRLYGTTSISIHEPKCLEKWQIENNQLPRHLRRKPPQPPRGWGAAAGSLSNDPRERQRQLDAMNDMSFQSAQSQLIPCENCGRTFNPDRLPVHQRSCRPGKPAKHSTGYDSGSRGKFESPAAKSPIPVKPRTVVCYICGREFGSQSINIHEPQCFKKWEMENSRLPRHLRRPPPVKPDILPSLSGSSNPGVDLERMNQIAYQSFKKQLVPCQNCGRTFVPDRLQLHMRSCKSSPGGMPAQGTRLAPLSGIGRDGTFVISKKKPKSPGSHLGYSDENSTQRPQRNIPPIRKISSKSQHVGIRNKKASSTKQPARLSPMSNARSPSPFHGNMGGLPGQSPDYNAPTEQSTGATTSLIPCSKCGRSFAMDRVAKHESICMKTNNRKVFDSTKMRTQGTEMSKYVRRGMSQTQPAKPKSNWRQNHEEFIRAVRDARKVQDHIKKGGKASDLPPPPPSENPDYVLCRFCTRRFAPQVAERHIPHCQKTINRPKPPKERALAAARNRGSTTSTRKYR